MTEHYEDPNPDWGDDDRIVPRARRLSAAAVDTPKTPEPRNRREMVIASEFKRMLSEAALLDEMIDNVLGLVTKIAERYQSISESADLIVDLGSSEIAAGHMAWVFGLIPHDPSGGLLPTQTVNRLQDLRDALPEIS